MSIVASYDPDSEGLCSTLQKTLTEEDIEMESQLRSVHRRRKVKSTGFAILMVGLFFAALAVHQIGVSHSSNSVTVDESEEKVQVKPDDGECAYGAADCTQSQCCLAAGIKCYEKEAGYSGCLKDGHCDTSCFRFRFVICVSVL